MKAVLDTNVWLDWLVFDDPSARELGLVAEAGALALLATPATRAEWLDVIGRPQFRLDAAAREAVAGRYDLHATLVDANPPVEDLPGQAVPPPPARVPLCRDPDDRKFVELAVAAGASFLVSRDKALLKLARQARRWHGLEIVRPEAPVWRDALAALLQGRTPRSSGAPPGDERL